MASSVLILVASIWGAVLNECHRPTSRWTQTSACVSDAVRHFSEAPSQVKGVVERGDARRSRDERNHVAGVHYGHRPTNNHTATGAAHLRGSPENNKNKNKTQTQGRTIKKNKAQSESRFFTHDQSSVQRESIEFNRRWGCTVFFCWVLRDWTGFYWVLMGFT